MPRYKVVLEFDHPGDGKNTDWNEEAASFDSITISPDKWNWSEHLDNMDEVSNLEVNIYRKPDQWQHLNTKSYK